MYEWGLIDLKRLHDDVEYWEQHDDPKQPDYDTRDIEDVINRQPTVDAIPVKWIENWVKETYPITEDWKDYMVSFGELIEVWEKENERR